MSGLRAVVEGLRERAVTDEPEVEAGWTVDEHVHELGTELPGGPLPNGIWERATALVRDYDFTPPELLRAAYLRDSALLGRDILLDGRFGPLRFLMGVRITEVVDHADEDGWRIWGWAYSTLDGHLQRGRVLYRVAKHRASGRVEFRASVRWRPDPRLGPVFGLGWGVFGRRSQLRFYRRIGERVRERAVLEPPGRRVPGTGPLILVPGDARPDPWDHARLRVAHPVHGRRLLPPAVDRA
ncbi:DUF1990 domain-containing protein [Pseudonocardia sp. RS11V-5]|uniref:DUF1990 family protein n=1 Tax=Pseudonocardia terrae TaxID=2905831 RepID=UPI001E6111BB|nr:DUF1990 family protein [Pseudonocardia terrae]MCE3550617.1 DUF1990 domain-containing protein [Pseudonocardia terrae]